MIIYILYYLVFKILSSFVRDSSYHNMYYKGCGLLCAHKKSFNTAIPVRSLGPYMRVNYCTCIVHILVSTYLFLLTSFFDCLSFSGLFLKHPYKRFFPFYILYFYQSRSLPYLSFYLSRNPVSLPFFLPLMVSSYLSLSHPAFLSIFFSRYFISHYCPSFFFLSYIPVSLSLYLWFTLCGFLFLFLSRSCLSFYLFSLSLPTLSLVLSFSPPP